MKRTINEVMDLLEQKRDSAITKLKREQEKRRKAYKIGKIFETIPREDLGYLAGEIDAYTDVICLIASSHLLDGGQHE